MYIGTLPSPLATSISATYLDVSHNQLTALPTEWTAGFTNATQSSFVNVFLQQNQIQVCFLTSTVLINIQLMSSASSLLQLCESSAKFEIHKDKVVQWSMSMHCCLSEGCELCTLSPFARHSSEASKMLFPQCLLHSIYNSNTTGYMLRAMSPAGHVDGHVDDALQHTSKAHFMSPAQLCQAQITPEVIAQARQRAWILLSATCSVQMPAESIPCSCGSLPRLVTVLCQQQQSEVCFQLGVFRTQLALLASSTIFCFTSGMCADGRLEMNSC